VKPRTDGIPKKFQLAGHTIEVRSVPKSKWKHGKDCVGIWMPDVYRIEIVSSLRGSNRQQVFTHELIHALLDVAGHDDLSRNEQLVDRLGHLLQQAMTTME
jgi:Zn-dependent peptidase ImmA (M78 family)